MTDEITPEIFDRLVELVAFTFDPQEAESLREELNKQLRAIQYLTTFTVDDNIPMASYGGPYPPANCPPLREDDWEPFENPQEILAQAPEVEDGYIIVPDIPHTELD